MLTCRISRAIRVGGTLLSAGCAWDDSAVMPGDVESGRAAALRGALLVDKLPAGKSVWRQDLSRLEDGFATGYMTDPVLCDDIAYLVASDDSTRAFLMGFDSVDGEVVCKLELPPSERSYARLLVFDGYGYAVSGAGDAVALSVDTGEVLWETSCVDGSWTTGETLDGEGRVVGQRVSRAPWYTTEMVFDDGHILVGFSTYVDSPGSHLLCLDASNGSIVWCKEYAGHLSFSGGTSQPCLTEAGLVVPVPEEPGLMLLDAGTGEELARVELDGLAGMGCVPLPGEPGRYLVQTVSGTLWNITVGDASLDAEKRVSLGSGDEGATLLGCGARPAVAGEFVLCNVPAADTAPISVAQVDLASFDATGKVFGTGFASTPAVLQKDGASGMAVFTLCDDDLWPSSFDGEFGRFERVCEDVSWDTGVDGASITVAADGALLVPSKRNGAYELVRIE